VAPGPEKWQVSSEEATFLRWASTGTLLYGRTDGKFFGVAVSSQGNAFHITQGEVKFGGRSFPLDRDWDLSHDGKRALVEVPTEATHSLKVLQNWNAASRQ
jgi:hypothetical protein